MFHGVPLPSRARDVVAIIMYSTQLLQGIGRGCLVRCFFVRKYEKAPLLHIAETVANV